jgi:hypothetical protein
MNALQGYHAAFTTDVMGMNLAEAHCTRSLLLAFSPLYSNLLSVPAPEHVMHDCQQSCLACPTESIHAPELYH